MGISKKAYPYEYFNSIDDHKKPVDSLKEADFFCKLEIKYADDAEVKGTKENIQLNADKNGEELTQLYLKSYVIILTNVFEKFIKVSFKEFEINHLYCVSLPGYTR